MRPSKFQRDSFKPLPVKEINFWAMAAAPEEQAPSTEQPAVDDDFDPFSDEGAS